jgi:2,4-dienoyl-CoA reductase-like NADH-dependent reductase (Old Yellow Enzyme family)
MTSTDVLFQPFTLKGVTFPNRIAMAPMTRSKSPNQVPDAQVAAYYRARAEGGVGLIITEGTSPEHRSASNDANVPAFFGGESLKGWANVAKEVKAAGGFIMPQLWHQGVIRHPGTGPYPGEPSMSPSGLANKDKKVAEPMTDSQIADVISGFARSAGYAKQLGFDGVELHGAHGYLIDQFFWETTNQRDDRHGGSIEQRTKFACDIVRAVEAEVGSDFPILLRFSQWKQQDFGVRLASTPKELEQFLTPLVDAGVDMFHCSTRRFWEPEFEGSTLNLAGWTKKLSGVPTMSVGSVSLNADFITSFRQAGAQTTGIESLIEMMERGEFDMIAVGRSLIVNPDWANKVRNGQIDQLKPYSPEALATLV